jgi:hypothetical protein
MRDLAVGLIVLFSCVLSFAQADHQTADSTSLPSAQARNATDVQPAAASAPEAPEHHFWDRTNILLFSGVAAFRGLDYASTRNFQARGRKEILLPQDVVDDSAAFASVEAAATAASVGISYIFHRTGHHTLERWVSITHIGVTGFGAVRNYCLVTKHPH